MGDCKSLQGWSNLFRRRISNSPERLTDCKFAGTPNGFQICRDASRVLPNTWGIVSKSVNPLGVPADLKSAVKKGSTYKHRGICNPPIKVNVSSYLVFLSLCYFEINNVVCTFKMKV